MRRHERLRELPRAQHGVHERGDPGTGTPNAAIYSFWDDLFVDATASVRTELLGSAPNRRFVIEWRNVHFFSDTTRRIDVNVVLHENGQILTQYRNLADDGRERGQLGHARDRERGRARSRCSTRSTRPVLDPSSRPSPRSGTGRRPESTREEYHEGPRTSGALSCSLRPGCPLAPDDEALEDATRHEQLLAAADLDERAHAACRAGSR